MPSSLLTKLLIVGISLNAVLGQMLLKRALATLGTPTTMTLLPRYILMVAGCPWIYASVAVQGFGFFCWMWLLSREKMGVAAAGVGAGFYILLPLFAWMIYGETLTGLQWFGIALLTIGITCVSVGTL